MKIEGYVANNRVFVSVEDVVLALRLRAVDFDRASQDLGDPLAGEAFTNAVAYRAIAEELRARADWLDVATTAHISA